MSFIIGGGLVYLVSSIGLEPTNGCSIELKRILQGQETSFIHLSRASRQTGDNSVPYHICLSDEAEWRWPIVFGRGAWGRFRQVLGWSWWNGEKLNKSRLSFALRRFPQPANAAYVICSSEPEARIMCAVLHALGNPPFVLHIFDLFHQGLTEKHCPQFFRLVQDASRVICVSGETEREVERIQSGKCTVIPPSTSFQRPRDRRWDGEFHLILSGTLGDDVLENRRTLDLLVEAAPMLGKKSVRLHYSGPSSRLLPHSLRPWITDHGRLSVDGYAELLRRCHAAYVPVTHCHDHTDRFSLPSRISDYLGMGLPVIASSDGNTGLFRFIRSLDANFACLVNSANDIESFIVSTVLDRKNWELASVLAAEFAAKNLHYSVVQQRIMNLIGKSAAGHCARL